MQVIELDIINYQQNDEEMDISIQLGEVIDQQQNHQSKPKAHNNQRVNIAVIAKDNKWVSLFLWEQSCFARAYFGGWKYQPLGDRICRRQGELYIELNSFQDRQIFEGIAQYVLKEW